jgi:hypothetical protein
MMPTSKDQHAGGTAAQSIDGHGAHATARSGETIYTPLALSVYDVVSLALSNPLVWRCPTRRLLDHYRQHLTDQHLEAGVGTGYLLDHSRFPGKMPRITLLDSNRQALDFASQRLGRYAPRARLEDVLAPIEFDDSYRSVAISYVLQSLSGTMQSKAKVVGHLQRGLAPGGVLFGATILGQRAAHSLPARALLALYNRQGIFNNQGDDAEGLASALQQHFERYQIEVVGSIALFLAHR